MTYYKIITFGCKVNSYESEYFKETFESMGMKESEDNLDVILINTCAVTNMGEIKARRRIQRMRRLFNNAIIITSGCASELHPELMIEAGANLILGSTHKNDIKDVLSTYKLLDGPKILVDNKKIRACSYEDTPITRFEERNRAYIKVQDGCDNFCAYCVIPMTRGNSRSRPLPSILKEVTTLLNNGYLEIVITGIDTASYSFEGHDFVYLLREIDKLFESFYLKSGIKARLRFSSIELSQISEEFLNYFKESKYLCPHIHIPLQSGCQTVLERMNRKYDLCEFKETVKKLREIKPFLGLTTDVIVGFVEETEEEFLKTFSFIQEVQFSRVHVFPYSPRPYTKAGLSKNQVPAEIKKDRVRKLILLGQKLERDFKKKQTEELTLLIETEKKLDDGTYLYHGYTENYIEVEIKRDSPCLEPFLTFSLLK